MKYYLQPPRIGGIKVYDKQLSRTEIMMDIDLMLVIAIILSTNVEPIT